MQSPQKLEQKIYFIDVSEKDSFVISKRNLYTNSVLLANNCLISNSKFVCFEGLAIIN